MLEDPYDDPGALIEYIPEKSPEPIFEKGDRLEDDWAPEDDIRSLSFILIFLKLLTHHYKDHLKKSKKKSGGGKHITELSSLK